MRGHIKQRGKTWNVIIELPRDVVTNKRKQKWYTVKGNKKEAEKFLTEKLRELDTGVLIDTKKMKFAEYLDYWIKEACENKLSITTLDGYKQNIEKHIKPYLGNLELEKITPLHLQNFYTDRLKNGRLNGKGGLSNKTVVTLHRIIHRALEQAVKWQLTIRNVADSVELPKPKKYKASFLNEKQTNILIEKAKKTDIYIPILIAIYTGMRRGEVLGLTWSNVNFDKGYILVDKALYSTSKGLEISSPKTEKSIRKIAIPKTLIKELKSYQIKQMKNRLKLGTLYQENNMVCCNNDGTFINPKSFSRKFHSLLTTNNLPLVRFHDLRHSHASLLVKLGVQPKVISERLGHSNISITMDLYSHVYEETDKEVANMFEKLIVSNG